MQSINSIIQLKAEIIFDIKVASLVNQYLSNVAVDPPITCLVGISQSAERNLTSNSYIAAKGICAQVQTNLKSISLIFAYIYIYFNKLTAISKTLTGQQWEKIIVNLLKKPVIMPSLSLADTSVNKILKNFKLCNSSQQAFRSDRVLDWL